MAQQENASTDQQKPSNSQNAQKKVTLELHKYILLLASLVATVTYAAAFSPPGDVWQDTADGHIAGDPIIRETHHRRYVVFFYCNATAFAASLVVIVSTLILAYLDDNKHKSASSSKSDTVVQYVDTWIALRTLQVAMVLDLLSLMGAYAAGTCRDTFSTVYSSVLVGVVVFYLVFQVTGSGGVPEGQVEEQHQARASSTSGNPNSASGGGVHEHKAVENGEERQKAKKMFRTAKNVIKSLTLFAPVPGSVHNKDEQPADKANDRARKVLMLLATFAVSITYLAGLSMPGGFWDSAGPGHRPGDAILKDRHNTRLAVFFGFNTLAFVASLLIIVVLLDAKPHGRLRHWFIVVALFSLVAAYNAGSCRQTDTTVYVASLIIAVVVYILFLFLVADYIYVKWDKMTEKFRGWLAEPSSPSIRNGGVNANCRVTEKEEAAKKARSLVLLLATLAATITYQAGLDPPGGIWQDNSGGHTAGDPILLTTNPRRYKVFFYCNSVSLVASLVAMVPVRSKLLLKHHVLEAVMILDLFGLIGAYAAGSCRDVDTSIHALALAGAVLVYVVIHVIFITLDDDTRKRIESDKNNKDKDLVEKTRKRLLLFAIFAATITYQAGLTPPGGFLLQDDLQSGSNGHHAGDPVLLYNFPRRYKAFFYCNSVSFMLSIALIILLVNPNLYRPAIRTHALSVCTAAGLFGLMGSYAAGSTQHLKTSIYVFVLIAVVLVCIALLFLVFLLTSGGGSRGEASTQVAMPTINNSNATTAAAAAAAAQGAVTSNNSNNTSSTQDNVGGVDNNKRRPETVDSRDDPAATTQDAATDTDGDDDNKKDHANRKYLMVLGILVASVTYQAGLEPPGGAWQSSSGWYQAGNPVMHDNRRPRYLAFFYSNSTSFMASIVVILLLLVPLQKLIDTAGNCEWLKWLVKLIGQNDQLRKRRWLVVMNTTIVLDLLGLLGAYAAGSSRRWKTSVYVLLLVIGVLIYMAFHLRLSCIIQKRNHRSSQQNVNSAAQCYSHPVDLVECLPKTCHLYG